MSVSSRPQASASSPTLLLPSFAARLQSAEPPADSLRPNARLSPARPSIHATVVFARHRTAAPPECRLPAVAGHLALMDVSAAMCVPSLPQLYLPPFLYTGSTVIAAIGSLKYQVHVCRPFVLERDFWCTKPL